MTRAFGTLRSARRRLRAGLSTGATVGGIVVLVLVLAIGVLIGRGTGLRYDAQPVAPIAGAPAVPPAAGTGDGSAATVAARARDGGAVAPAGAAAPAVTLPKRAGPPPIAFDPVELDFGTVLPDTDVQGTFTITNVSDEPVTIAALKPTCKCTTMNDLAGTVIPPGGSIESAVMMEGPAASGGKQASVAVIIDGYAPASIKLKMRVGRVVIATPSAISPSPNLIGEIRLAASDDRPFRILAANDMPPTYTDGFVPGTDAPRASYTIAYDLARYDQKTCFDAEGNRMPVWWIVETDHPDAPLVDLMVRHVPCSLPEPLNGRSWILSKQRVILGNVVAGKPFDFTVDMTWLRGITPNDTIREVRTESGLFAAELVETTRDEEKITCRVRITPRDGYEGVFKGDARFFGYLAGHSQALRIIGRVAPAGTEHASR